jgi:50S ribosomal subunit-associated GTPase HflX
LLHVLDANNAQWPRQSRAVETILHELELDRTPRLRVFNKSDLGVAHTPESDAVYVSAKTGAGLAALRAAIVDSFL